MKKIYVFAFALFIQFTVLGQNPKIDKLEMLFEQGHYQRVYRKSNQLLDNPDYDFSMLPTYYKSISLFQLSQNKHWLSKNKEALLEAEKLYLIVKESPEGYKLFNAHMYELIWLKNDLTSWAEDLKIQNEESEFLQVQKIINDLFDDVKGDVSESSNVTEEVVLPLIPENIEEIELRDEVIMIASQYIGKPYVWAGNSPDGFDCSGFTSYVMKKNGKDLPRRAVDQYDASVKVKKKNVEKGDLVFFDNGSGVSHVGIVISEKGEPLKMIHSSSSKGIIITDVSKSEYWSKRLHGFGTYLN